MRDGGAGEGVLVGGRQELVVFAAVLVELVARGHELARELLPAEERRPILAPNPIAELVRHAAAGFLVGFRRDALEAEIPWLPV